MNEKKKRWEMFVFLIRLLLQGEGLICIERLLRLSEASPVFWVPIQLVFRTFFFNTWHVV